MTDSFSDYVVYVDESGDAGMKNIDEGYPVLCLAFCIFKKQEYAGEIVPAFSEFKFRYWGHDAIVLHESSLHKMHTGKYAFLAEKEKREAFLTDLETLIDQSPFHVTASVIHKSRLQLQYSRPADPYELAVLLCMDLLLNWLVAKGEAGKIVHVIFASRGDHEDKKLKLEFYRIIGNKFSPLHAGSDFSQIKFIPLFIPKTANQTGLQVADLIARPIGLSVIRPQQPNRAYATIRKKFIGGGLKVFPE